MIGPGDAPRSAPGALKDAIAVVIQRHGLLLFIQRARDESFGGYWTPVTGALEPGETQEDAARRESREEVGLEVLPVRKVWECPTFSRDYLLHWWLADWTHGEVQADPREVGQALWLPAAAIARLRPTFPQDIEFYEKIYPGL